MCKLTHTLSSILWKRGRKWMFVNQITASSINYGIHVCSDVNYFFIISCEMKINHKPTRNFFHLIVYETFFLLLIYFLLLRAEKHHYRTRWHANEDWSVRLKKSDKISSVSMQKTQETLSTCGKWNIFQWNFPTIDSLNHYSLEEKTFV